MKNVHLLIAMLVATGAGSAALRGGNATIPGAVTVPYPTIHNLAVEWPIDGDDNGNGGVTVRYRKVGDGAWRQGMPLRRVPAGASREPRMARSWTSRHSGSIFDLSPATEYEIELRLVDPDGGSAVTVVASKTRPVPAPMPGAPVKPVTPKDLAAVAAAAAPGDILLLAPGYYGMLTIARDGLPGKPLVFRADPDDRRERNAAPGGGGHREFVVFDGISLQGRRHVILDGLVSTDTIDLFNTVDCAVQRCRVTAVFGIVSGWTTALAKWAPAVAARVRNPPVKGGGPPTRSTNCYIADNIVQGVTSWEAAAFGAMGRNAGEGIQVSGPGNVICHNRVTGFRDCISTLEDEYAVEQQCIDIYNNDIYSGCDDGIEADFCLNNCRIYRNRLTNCFIGLSSQPGLGGPTYFIRNVMYNLVGPTWKLYRHSVGDVVLHNTVVKTGDASACGAGAVWSQAYFRNNLAIGGGTVARFGAYDNGQGLAVNYRAADGSCDFDYNGYGMIGLPFQGEIGGRPFDSIASLRGKTSEKHSVQVDLKVFAAAVTLPDPPVDAYLPPDLRLRGGAAAVDAGEVIPNINDQYAGGAPDLGAYELGQALPIYGPRE